MAELQDVEKAQKDLESALEGLVAVKGEEEIPVVKQEVIAKTTETEKKSGTDEKTVKSVKTGDEAKAVTSALMALYLRLKSTYCVGGDKMLYKKSPFRYNRGV